MRFVVNAGETEEQHRELVAFCKKFKFERMGAFSYSEEDGTPAAEMPDQVWNDSVRKLAQVMQNCTGKLLADLRRTACMMRKSFSLCSGARGGPASSQG